MWVKGGFLGLGVFVVGTLVFLLAVFKPRTNTAIGLSAIAGLTYHNPWFWIALVACLALGLAIIGSWPVRQ